MAMLHILVCFRILNFGRAMTAFFDFAPAALPVDQALNIVNSSLPQPYGSGTTWGGSVVGPDAAGDYHMYASVFSGECGLDSWETNSQVVHSVSSTGPAGPYQVKDVAIRAFAHNPEVVYSASDKKYLLFTLGGKNESAPLPCESGKPIGRWGGSGPPPWLSTVRLHVSDSPYGPWQPLLNSTSGQPLVLATGLNANPTVWVDASNGEITLLHGYFDKPHRPHSRFYAVQRAPTWKGPYETLGVLPTSVNPPDHCSQDPSSPWHECMCNNEDPFLFKLDGRWHLLFHQYTLSTARNNKSIPCAAMHDATAGPDPSTGVVGGHAVSESADILGNWSYDYWTGAYSMAIQWVSPAPPLTRRERPKLLFNLHGEPAWLFNGVSLDASDSNDGDRNCFTLAQAITRFGDVVTESMGLIV